MQTATALLVVLFVLVFALSIGLGLLLRRLLWRRAYREGGWNRWRRTARMLTWRDRWALYRANLLGRAVREPRLAPLATERGEIVFATIGKAINRLRVVMVFVALTHFAMACLELSEGLTGTAITYLFTGGCFLAAPELTRWSAHLAKRSADANRGLVAPRCWS